MKERSTAKHTNKQTKKAPERQAPRMQVEKERNLCNDGGDLISIDSGVDSFILEMMRSVTALQPTRPSYVRFVGNVIRPLEPYSFSHLLLNTHQSHAPNSLASNQSCGSSRARPIKKDQGPILKIMQNFIIRIAPNMYCYY